MSRGWKRTDLVMGEDLVLPDEYFEVPAEARKRIVYCVYAGETDTGIIVEVQFKAGIGSEDPLSSWRVEYFASFASIYSGQIKIYRRDRTLVRAERIREIYRR